MCYFLKFKQCHCKLIVWAKNGHFYCGHRLSDVARGPDVVHHCCNSTADHHFENHWKHQLIPVFGLRTLWYIQFLHTSQHHETVRCCRNVSYDSLYVGWMSCNRLLAGSLLWHDFKYVLLTWTLFPYKCFGAPP